MGLKFHRATETSQTVSRPKRRGTKHATTECPKFRQICAGDLWYASAASRADPGRASLLHLQPAKPMNVRLSGESIWLSREPMAALGKPRSASLSVFFSDFFRLASRLLLHCISPI